MIEIRVFSYKVKNPLHFIDVGAEKKIIMGKIQVIKLYQISN